MSVERNAEEYAPRPAGREEAAAVARLLHDFNREYDEPTPPVAVLAPRVEELIAAGELTVLVAGRDPVAVAVLRFKPSLWNRGLDAYLEELYVVPRLRGRGIGRRLLGAAMDAARAAGAGHIELNTGETDVEARGLYESSGFTNREGGPDGPSMLYYEREL